MSDGVGLTDRGPVERGTLAVLLDAILASQILPRGAFIGLLKNLIRNYRGAGSIGSGPSALLEIPRIANAIGNAAAQSSAMTQNAFGPNAP
jgi:hypothetical protein